MAIPSVTTAVAALAGTAKSLSTSCSTSYSIPSTAVSSTVTRSSFSSSSTPTTLATSLLTLNPLDLGLAATSTSSRATNEAQATSSTHDTNSKVVTGAEMGLPHLKIGQIAGIIAGAITFVAALILLFILVRRCRRKRTKKSLLPTFVAKKLGRMSVATTASLTSFDTRTEYGVSTPRTREKGLHLYPEMSQRKSKNGMTERAALELDIPEPVPAIPASRLSTGRSSNSSLSPLSLPQQAYTPRNRQSPRRSTSSLRSLNLPKMVGLPQNPASFKNQEPQLPSKSPRLSILTPQQRIMHLSRCMSSHIFHALSPITDKTSHRSTRSESSCLSPLRDFASARTRFTSKASSMSSVPLIADFPSLHNSASGSPTISSPPAIFQRNKKTLAASPVSAVSPTSTITQATSKPLPASPLDAMAPPAPPPPFSPPPAPAYTAGPPIPPKPPAYTSRSSPPNSPPLRLSASKMMIPGHVRRLQAQFARPRTEIRSEKGSVYGFNRNTQLPYDLVQVESQTFTRTTSVASTTRTMVRVQPYAHIATQAKAYAEMEADILLPARPVLRLDTSSVTTSRGRSLSASQMYLTADRYTPGLTSATTPLALSAPAPSTLRPYKHLRTPSSASNIGWSPVNPSHLSRADSMLTSAATIQDDTPPTTPESPTSRLDLPIDQNSDDGYDRLLLVQKDPFISKPLPPQPKADADYEQPIHFCSEDRSPSIAVPIVLKFRCPLKQRRARQGYMVPQNFTWKIMDKRQLKRKSEFERQLALAQMTGETGIVSEKADAFNVDLDNEAPGTFAHVLTMTAK